MARKTSPRGAQNQVLQEIEREVCGSPRGSCLRSREYKAVDSERMDAALSQQGDEYKSGREGV